MLQFVYRLNLTFHLYSWFVTILLNKTCQYHKLVFMIELISRPKQLAFCQEMEDDANFPVSAYTSTSSLQHSSDCKNFFLFLDRQWNTPFEAISCNGLSSKTRCSQKVHAARIKTNERVLRACCSVLTAQFKGLLYSVPVDESAGRACIRPSV